MGPRSLENESPQKSPRSGRPMIHAYPRRLDEDSSSSSGSSSSDHASSDSPRIPREPLSRHPTLQERDTTCGRSNEPGEDELKPSLLGQSYAHGADSATDLGTIRSSDMSVSSLGTSRTTSRVSRGPRGESWPELGICSSPSEQLPKGGAKSSFSELVGAANSKFGAGGRDTVQVDDEKSAREKTLVQTPGQHWELKEDVRFGEKNFSSGEKDSLCKGIAKNIELT